MVHIDKNIPFTLRSCRCFSLPKKANEGNWGVNNKNKTNLKISMFKTYKSNQEIIVNWTYPDTVSAHVYGTLYVLIHQVATLARGPSADRKAWGL